MKNIFITLLSFTLLTACNHSSSNQPTPPQTKPNPPTTTLPNNDKEKDKVDNQDSLDRTQSVVA